MCCDVAVIALCSMPNVSSVIWVVCAALDDGYSGVFIIHNHLSGLGIVCKCGVTIDKCVYILVSVLLI